MLHLLKEIRTLRDEGKLHRRLLIRVRMLFVISAILFAVVAYNITTRGTDIALAGALLIIGLLLGVFIFSRMNVVQWNEEEEILEAGRMDLLGYTSLGLYIAFEIGARTALKDFFPASATVLILATIAGTLFGRALGTLVEIHRVYLRTHSSY